MLNAQQIDDYVSQIIKILENDPNGKRKINELIGHLNANDRLAVIQRSREVSNQIIELERLGVASGRRRPNGALLIPWLIENGLIQEKDGLMYFQPAKPRLVTKEE